MAGLDDEYRVVTADCGHIVRFSEAQIANYGWDNLNKRECAGCAGTDCCSHESWECTGDSGSYIWHKCNECDFSWSRGSAFFTDGQVGLCNICQDTDSKFITKDSGKREGFDSGAVRDTQTGKPRYDLVPPKGLKRVAELYARGAEKYDEMNWTKGMPSSRFMASLMRHVEAYRRGERDEDHIAAVVFNALALIEFEDSEFDDLKDMWTDD